MNNKLLIRRNEIIKLSSENNDDVNIIIYIFAINHKLDSLLNKLDDINIPTEVKSIVKKNYLTSVEHFYQVLYHFINYINTNFWFISKHKNYIIEKIINTKEAEKVLYHKKYIHDNSTIPYYKYHFNKAIIANFYRFLKIIPISKDIYVFLKKHNINLDTMDIEKEDNINNLFYIIKLICVCNNHDFGLLYVFDDNLNPKGIQHTALNFEGLISTVEKYEEIYKKLLDNY